MITLWTLTPNKSQWKDHFKLRRWDSSGNVLDRIEKQRGSALKYVEYSNQFAESIKHILDEYTLSVYEISSYDNDDYPEYSYENRVSEYNEALSLENIVISDNKPVGYLYQETSYGGGMDSRAVVYGNVVYFDAADRKSSSLSDSFTISTSTSRKSSNCKYTLIRK